MTDRRTFFGASLLVTALPALAWPAAASAAPNIAMDSDIYVERRDSESARQLEPADSLAKGDRVVTIVRWQRMGGDGGFTITNPLPRAISYQQSSRTDEEVSVNGGRTWGRLQNLRVGNRNATPEDVTHVRWRISPGLSSQGRGQIAYAGIVR